MLYGNSKCICADCIGFILLLLLAFYTDIFDQFLYVLTKCISAVLYTDHNNVPKNTVPVISYIILVIVSNRECYEFSHIPAAVHSTYIFIMSGQLWNSFIYALPKCSIKRESFSRPAPSCVITGMD